MKKRGIFLLSLTMAALLGGCDPARDAALAYPASLFGETTREADPTDPEGRSFILRTTSKVEATWGQAMGAFSAANAYCADGASFTIDLLTPADDELARDPAATKYPAGTVFEQRIRCLIPFPQERVVEPGMSDEEAFDRIKSELADGGAFDPDRHQVTRASFNDRNPKYSAIHKALGYMLANGDRSCRGAGVQFRKLIVDSRPTPQGEGLNASDAFVGTEYACLDGLPPDRSL